MAEATKDGNDAGKQTVFELENGGIVKKILKHGQGGDDETPEDGSDVTVHYVGRLLDGTVFDSSRDRNEPFKFKIGQGQVIKGWDKGVATMKKGELAILTCRADYAYGARGSPPKIPPNATLEFEVELLKWSNKESVTKSGGVSKACMKKGDGYQTPMEGCACTVSYTLSLPDGKKLAEVKEAKITVTDLTLTEGFDEAVKNMKRGERSKFFVAPHYGYGEKGNQQRGVPPNSNLIYEIELISFDKGKDTWDMNNVEKLAFATKIKEAGNTLFKGQFLHWARKKYQQALRVVSHPDNDLKADADLMKQLNQLNTSCASNLALIRIKEQNWTSALKHANKALEADSNNVKAYVRRGQVKFHNGENEDALADFKRAISLDAKAEAEVKPLLAAVQKKINDQRQKERNVFGGMFSKVNLSGDSGTRAAAASGDKS